MGIATTLARMGHLERSKSFFLKAEGDKNIVIKIAKNFGVELNLNNENLT
jgi:hypothetical protein